MNMKYSRIVVVAFTVIFNIPVVQSANKTELTRPANVAEQFLKGMEEMLTLESKGQRKEAKAVSLKVSDLISEETINREVAVYGKSTANLSPESIDNVQTGIFSEWAAVINFYQGHLDYSRMDTTIPFLEHAQNDIARILIPVANIKGTHPVNLVVICVHEKDQWKIRLLKLEPVRQEGTNQTETQPGK
jgi:hypothetical protein